MSDEGITLRYFDGCPNWQVAKSRLDEALEDIGERPTIRYERVETPEQADHLGFRGSPTILIDGTDPFAEPDAPTGLSCRVFRTENGLEGSPSVSQLVAALKET